MSYKLKNVIDRQYEKPNKCYGWCDIDWQGGVHFRPFCNTNFRYCRFIKEYKFEILSDDYLLGKEMVW